MKNTTKLRAIISAVIISAVAAAGITGCTKKQDIDMSLLDGIAQTEENNYNVDIRHDTEEIPVNSDTEAGAVTTEPEEESSVPKEEKTAPPTTTTPAESEKPAVTITTNKPEVTTPAQTVRTDRPVVTTAPATTTTAPYSEPEIQQEYDDNGFPENPEVNQHFVDENGQEWAYNAIFGWVESGGDVAVDMREFPNHGGDYFNDEPILN